MNFPIVCFLLLVNRYVTATPAPQLNALEYVPSATELRKTVQNPVAGSECSYGKVHTLLRGLAVVADQNF